MSKNSHFKQEVQILLLEITPRYRNHYSEGHLRSSSTPLAGLLLLDLPPQLPLELAATDLQ